MKISSILPLVIRACDGYLSAAQIKVRLGVLNITRSLDLSRVLRHFQKKLGRQTVNLFFQKDI